MFVTLGTNLRCVSQFILIPYLCYKKSSSLTFEVVVCFALTYIVNLIKTCITGHQHLSRLLKYYFANNHIMVNAQLLITAI